LEPIREEYRERSTFSILENMAQDIRYAVRTLKNNRGFTTASVATLALAIGANTAMFSVLDTVLLRPLPYRSPEQLAMLWTESPGENLREGRSGYWNVEAWRQSKSFADMAAFDGVSVTLTSADRADRVTVARVSPNFFSVLGVQPLVGRVFSSEEAEQRERVALIGHRFWQMHFGGSSAAIGASIELNGLPSRIIGILPARFYFSKLDADVWEPHTMFPDWETRRAVRGADTWSVIARLQPQVSFQQAQAEMSTIARRLDEQLPPAEQNRGIAVVPLTRHVVGSKSRFALWMLTGALVCVLLIAAFNVASLALARSITRAREFAIRAALGATRVRMAHQLIVENVTLAVISGIAGSLLALVIIRLIRSLESLQLARLSEVTLDLRVLTAALAISAMTGIMVGLTPAMLVWRRDLRSPVEEGGRSMSGGVAAGRLRRALVVSEFALAIVLLVAAGLLVRSWRMVENVDSGFRPERVLTVELRTPVGMPAAQRVNFYNNVLGQVAALPGVESAGFTSDLFISSTHEQILTPETEIRNIPERIQFRRDEVGGDFFRTAGTRLLKGRFFSAADRADSPRVVIINDALAHRLWPGIDPAGRRFKFGAAQSTGPWFTVVGVVADMRRQGVEREPVPQIFEPVAQNPSGGGSLLVRTTLDDPLPMAPSIQAAIRRVEKYAPTYGVATLESRLAAYLMPRRFQTSLVVAFSATALLLACIGIYGLIQYSIATRTKEIGIRMAVGAHAGDIFRMIISEGLRLSLIGLVIGLAGALVVSRATASLLFGISPTDPLTFISVSLLLTVVAVAACYLAARRATRVEPVLALRL
jgi:putative ABC transport system permease protein